MDTSSVNLNTLTPVLNCPSGIKNVPLICPEESVVSAPPNEPPSGVTWSDTSSPSKKG